MMQIPFFSIIIPTLNAGQKLPAALDSILNQTFQEFEILIIDGKSSDDTVARAKQYGDTRIRVVSEKDGGIYPAMNKGIGMATAEWLYFLGSDDTLYDNNVLREIGDFIRANSFADFVYGNVFSPRLGDDYDGVFDQPKLLQRNICHQAIFYRKALFDKTGLFNANYSYCADHDLNLRCFYNDAIKIAHLPRRIAYYHSEGLSGQLHDYYAQGRHRPEETPIAKLALKERYLMLNTLRTIGVSEEYVEQALEKQARRLMQITGIPNAVLGMTGGMIQEFSGYDPKLRQRIWKLVRNKISRFVWE